MLAKKVLILLGNRSNLGEFPARDGMLMQMHPFPLIVAGHFLGLFFLAVTILADSGFYLMLVLMSSP